MNIQFRILWVDDDEEWFGSTTRDQSQLLEHLADSGFSPELRFIADIDQLPKGKQRSQYDLLVVDLNLSDEGKNGARVIDDMRSGSLVCEAVFYTQKQRKDLINEAAARGLEGVF